MADHILVLDTSPLSHFARAGELVTLRELVAGFECVTTKAVLGELERGVERYPALRDAIDLEWVRTVPCDELEELYLFGRYMRRLGTLERNAGEASVLAWAEANSAAAYVDDQVACNVARSRGVPVHRTLHLVVNAVRTKTLTEAKASAIVAKLADADARFPPAAREDLFDWARSQHPPLL